MTDDDSRPRRLPPDAQMRVELAQPSRWLQIPTDIDLAAAINMLIENWPQPPAAIEPEVETIVTATKFHVSCLPPDQLDSRTWGIDVESTGRGTWAVRHLGQCLDVNDGYWDPEPLPSSRNEEWRVTHRFPLAEAIAAAREAAPDIVVNGLTAAEVARKTS